MEQTPQEVTDIRQIVANNVAFMFSVIRCGELLSDAEEAVIRANVAKLCAPPADCVIGKYCCVHNFIHGAEAEELRSRVETMLGQVQLDEDDAAEALHQALRVMLEEVDARDSAAYLDERAALAAPHPPEKAVDTPMRTTAAELLQHVQRDHALISRQDFIECSCGTTFWFPESATGRRAAPPQEPTP